MRRGSREGPSSASVQSGVPGRDDFEEDSPAAQRCPFDAERHLRALPSGAFPRSHASRRTWAAGMDGPHRLEPRHRQTGELKQRGPVHGFGNGGGESVRSGMATYCSSRPRPSSRTRTMPGSVGNDAASATVHPCKVGNAICSPPMRYQKQTAGGRSLGRFSPVARFRLLPRHTASSRGRWQIPANALGRWARVPASQ